MVIFIDESGTHKQTDHATIALVYVEIANLEKFEEAVEKIVAVRKDESSPGIRVSDCLAGLIRYHYDNPESLAKQWYNKLKKTDRIKFELTTY